MIPENEILIKDLITREITFIEQFYLVAVIKNARFTSGTVRGL